jgi:hypothetical protein
MHPPIMAKSMPNMMLNPTIPPSPPENHAGEDGS